MTQSITLPNGLEVYGFGKLDTAVLYHEIFDLHLHEAHGLTVNDGDCVFDVGANIGLFSMRLAQAHERLRIFAFEPIPETFAVLRRNAERHLGNASVTLCNHGLADRAGRADFSFDPAMRYGASMVPQQMQAARQKDTSATEWARAFVADMERNVIPSLDTGPLIGRVLTARWSRPAVRGALFTLAASQELFGRRRPTMCRCTLKRLSDVIAEHEVAQIDFLKIDVEGAELAVLAGIDEQDWPRIRQISVEVHDLDGRVAKIEADLQRRGFRTAVVQEDWEMHKLMNIFTVFGARVG